MKSKGLDDSRAFASQRYGTFVPMNDTYSPQRASHAFQRPLKRHIVARWLRYLLGRPHAMASRVAAIASGPSPANTISIPP